MRALQARIADEEAQIAEEERKTRVPEERWEKSHRMEMEK